MKKCELASLALILGLGATALTANAGLPRTAAEFRARVTPNATKITEQLGKEWNPKAGLPGLNAEVPETEPNDLPPDEVDTLACGDTYRPAAIDVPDDFDYFTFEGVAGAVLTFGTDADGPGDVEDTIIGIFDELGNLIAFSDDDGPNFYSLISDFPLPYTGTYYGAIAGYDEFITGNYQAFLNCEAPPPPPENDTCAGAIKLECAEVNLSGTTAGANNDYTPAIAFPDGCTGYSANGNDVVYVITLPDDGIINLSYTSAADGSFYLINDCVSPADGACVAGADATFSGEKEVLSYVNNSGVGQTLYLILDNFGTGAFGSFTLTGSISCPPVPVTPTSWSQVKARAGN